MDRRGRSTPGESGAGPHGAAPPARGRRRWSLAGRLAALAAVTVVVAALAAALASALGAGPVGVALAVAGVGLPAAVLLAARFAREPLRVLEALITGVQGFRSGDFSLRLATRREDELGELVEVYNAAGDILRRERASIRQRELLLQSMVESSGSSILLVDSVGRVVFASRSARRLLGDGRRLEGRALDELLERVPGALAEAVRSGSASLVAVEVGGDEETFHVARRSFELNASRHLLVTVRRMTPELRRQEVQVWKRLIRVVGHELNNGLAPISSLLHSARIIRDRPEAADRLDEVLSAIEDSVFRLRRFVDGYARFARLPAPRPEPVRLAPFLRQVAELEPCRFLGCPEELTVEADPAQLQVVLVNLVKNASEAGSPVDRIELSAAGGVDAVTLRVSDRGPGMDEETLTRALVPFYSSKKAGSGLGLALCREIVEAHGGSLELANRAGGGLEVAVRLRNRFPRAG